MYLKSDLDWMIGFPVAQGTGVVEWQPMPKLGEPLPGRLRVDRERLTRTQLTLTKLVNRFPRAMPKVVGNVVAWQLRVVSVLDRLKGAIHDGADLVNELESWHMTASLLQPAASAVVWSGMVNPAASDERMKWLVQNSDWLHRHVELVGADEGLMNVLLLSELVRDDGAEAWHWVSRILSDTRCFTVPTHGFESHVGSLIGWLRGWSGSPPSPVCPERPAATFGPQLVEFIRQVAAENRGIRRRAAQLASFVMDAKLVDSWSNAWDNLDRECSPAIRGLQEQAQYLSQWSFGFQKQTLIGLLEEFREAKPQPFPLRDLLKNVLRASREASPRLASALSDLLASVPSNPGMTRNESDFDIRSWAMRGAILDEFARSSDDRDEDRQAVRYLELFAGFLRRHRAEHWVFAPWQSVIQKWSHEKRYWSSLFRTLQSEIPATKHWPVVFEIIGRVAAHPQFSSDHHEELIALYEAASDIEVACRRYFELLATDQLDATNTWTLSAASSLEVEPNTFAQLCSVLSLKDSEEWQTSSKIVALHECLRAAGWPILIPRMLGRGEVSQVAITADRLALLRDLKTTLPPIARPSNPVLPEWAELLPESLHEPMSVLAAISPKARTQVEGVLERYFPSHEKLDREIAAIEQRLRSATNREDLEKRLSSLRQRRDAPKPVAAETIARLREKLHEITTRWVVASFREAIESELAQQFCARTGFQQIAEYLSTPRYLELVTGIVKLPEPYREFGLRLLRRRWGNQPWDSQAEPANQRFLEQLRYRGLHVEPWLAPMSPLVVTDPAGRRITISFEQDDVERLLMGYYFDTCLSPRGFNFFSAVTNSVDINKRVLFARDEKNHVVGRCLLAIGNAGTILTFNPYCNAPECPFDQHVAAIAAQLACEMGTVVSHLDQVSPLLTPRWYDDGARDLGLSITSDSSAVRAALRSATEENLISMLNVALAPHGLTETTLALVIEMPEMTQQPTLIKSLLLSLEQCESRLAPTTRIQAANLAHQANCHEFAARIICRYGPEWLIRNYRYHNSFHGLAETAINALVFYQPSVALRVLRQTRHKSVRDDESETDPHRRKLLAAAHKTLGRDNLAKSLNGQLQETRTD